MGQSHVLAGGEAGVDYIRLMAALLAGGGDILLLGCGGGALATMLHRRGRSVTVVDVNPISFQLARTFFWMPDGVECVTLDMRDFVRNATRTFDAIGIDVGGPCFAYEKVLEPAVVAHVRRASARWWPHRHRHFMRGARRPRARAALPTCLLPLGSRSGCSRRIRASVKPTR